MRKRITPAYGIYAIALLVNVFGACKKTGESQPQEKTTTRMSCTKPSSGFTDTTSNDPEAPLDFMTIESNDSLIIYYPKFGKIELVCETMPSSQDSSVLFCCEAAFTGYTLKEFRHGNIAGDHVASGKLYKGYRALSNTGCFAYYPDSKTWEFAYHDYVHCLRQAEASGGMAFGQNMIIYNGKNVYVDFKTDWHRNMKSKNQYRALCELKGKLCIIDSKNTVPYEDFVKALHKEGVTHALYLDMGSGWNYSFYRDNKGEVHYIHDHNTPYTTNWITFYK